MDELCYDASTFRIDTGGKAKDCFNMFGMSFCGPLSTEEMMEALLCGNLSLG